MTFIPPEQPPGTYPRTSDMEEMARRCFPDTLAFYLYWQSKCRPACFTGADGIARAMPARADIDPVEMKRWLPCIQLIDVFENPRRLVYRLVGESEVSLRGYNPRGRDVAEAAIGKSSSDPLGNYRIVVDERKPVYDWSRIDHPNGFLVAQECVLLPLSDNGIDVNMVITYGKMVPRSGMRR